MRVALIPARGGSVRIPRKNIRPFYGKPIIAYSIECAKQSGLFDRICVSTDDQEIAEVAQTYGAEVLMRPETLAQVGTQEVAAYAIQQLATKDAIPNRACVIYATSPLLLPDDLKDGLCALERSHSKFAMSVGTEPLRDAGAYYWGEGWAFLKALPLIAPHTAMVPLPESRVCDVNTYEDFSRAERMYANRLESMRG